MKKTKFFLSAVIIAAMIFTVLLFVPSFADSNCVTGRCGDNLTYTLNVGAGVLEITGTGNLGDVMYWSGYENIITKVIFDDRIEGIGEYNFYGMYRLTSITLPLNLKTVGQYAFGNCYGLSGDLYVPQGVTYLGRGSFQACSGLNGVLHLPDSIYYDCSYAFCGTHFTKVYNRTHSTLGLFSAPSYGNVTVKNISNVLGSNKGTLPYNVKWVLWDDGLLGYYGQGVIPATDSTNYDAAIQNATSLYISRGIVQICANTFDNCRNLSGNLILPDTVTYIGSSAFLKCSGLTGTLVLPENITFLGGLCFYGCSGFTGTLVIPGTLPRIEAGVFARCTGFTKVIFPSSFTAQEGVPVTIEATAFQGCTGLNCKLSIPSNVTEIKARAFQNCKNLYGNLIIPEGVTTIQDYAFSGCEGFTGDLILPNKLGTLGKRAFAYCSGLNGRLVIPESLPCIEDGTFYECCNIRYLEFPESFKVKEGVTAKIGDSAFYQCKRITGTVVIPNNVTEIKVKAFYRCQDITGLQFGNGKSALERIESNAFYNCWSLTGDLIIPASVNYICQNPFTFHLFNNIYVESGNTVYKSENNCVLTDFQGYSYGLVCFGTRFSTIPDNGTVKYIGPHAFEGVYYRYPGYDVHLPYGLLEIGYAAFSTSNYFGDTLEIPTSVKKIGPYAFSGCTFRTLVGFTNTEVQYSDSRSRLNDYDGLEIGFKAFFQSHQIGGGDLCIPYGVISIGDYAFQNCGFNGILTLPSSLRPRTNAPYTDSFGVYYSDIAPATLTMDDSGIQGLGRRLFDTSACCPHPSYFTAIFNFSNASFDPADQRVCNNAVVYSQNQITGFRSTLRAYVNSSLIYKYSGGEYRDINGHTISWGLWTDGTLYVYGRGIMNSGTMVQAIDAPYVRELILSDGLTHIGSNNFSGFTGLCYLHIPSSVTSIGSRAFYGCSNISGPLNLPSNIVQIGAYAFGNCSRLSGTVVIDRMRTTLGTGAFSGCTNLQVKFRNTGIGRNP